MRLVQAEPPLADAAGQIGRRVLPLLRGQPADVLVTAPMPVRFAGLNEVIDRQLRDVLHRETDRWQSLVAAGDRVVSAVDVAISDGEFVIVSVTHGTYAAQFDQALAFLEGFDASDFFGGSPEPEPVFEVAGFRIPGLSLSAVHLFNVDLETDFLALLHGENPTPVADIGGRVASVADLEDVLAERAEEARDQWDAANSS